jgi:hypothetical protein
MEDPPSFFHGDTGSSPLGIPGKEDADCFGWCLSVRWITVSALTADSSASCLR